MKSEQRDVGIDLIKSLALIFVFALHFILHNDMYSVNVNNWGMYLMVLVRTLCMTCVPLFLMATGYLMNQKIFSKKYYMKIDRILIMYVIISLVIWLFRVYYMQEVIPLKVGISEMLGYSSAGYQWYVEMYIGLYLLIPFLNKFWHSLEQKEKKQIIGVISLLVTVPTIFACIKDIKILPEWWKNIWPLLFIF